MNLKGEDCYILIMFQSRDVSSNPLCESNSINVMLSFYLYVRLRYNVFTPSTVNKFIRRSPLVFTFLLGLFQWRRE